MIGKEVDVKKMCKAVNEGRDRLYNFRQSRLMFLKAFIGQYYDKERGSVGDQPLNLIFNAISIIMPNLVANFPKSVVTSRFLLYRGYAELLGMGLDYLSKELDLKSSLRRWIVDAIFTMGVIKTGIATSKDLITFSEDETVDAGRPYVEVVDFDDWFMAPDTRQISSATFVGHRLRAPRQMLMDSGLFANDIIERLPMAGAASNDRGEVQYLSQQELSPTQINDLQDNVELLELWVPAAKANVWLPANKGSYEKYLRIDDYYGPDEGPFTYLTLTPPVPGNPLPIAPVSIWHDLHIMANKMAKKVMEQADRQKTVLGYKRAAADDAQSLIDAGDGEAVAMDDPQGAITYKWGGQEQSNEAHLQQLSYWFSLMSGNTDQLGGLKTNADTATGQNILQTNGNVRLEDMRDLVYCETQKVLRKLAWFLHTDPLIALPMIKRTPIPAQTVMTAMGPIMVAPPHFAEEQVILSPDVRQGEFLDFQFEIEYKSMSRQDPADRLQKALMFASKVLPAAAAAAQVCAQMGVPFSFSKFTILLAKELGLEWMDEVFYDPEFQMQMSELVSRTPQINQSKGIQAGAMINPTARGLGTPNQNEPGGIVTPENMPNMPGPAQQANQAAQVTAAGAQSARQPLQI